MFYSSVQWTNPPASIDMSAPFSLFHVLDSLVLCHAIHKPNFIVEIWKSSYLSTINFILLSPPPNKTANYIIILIFL